MTPQPPGLRMVRLLGTVSLLCGVLIVGTNLATSGRIRHNQEIIMRESVAELLPGISKQIIYGIEPSGELKIVAGIEAGGPRLFAGYDAAGNFLGVVIETSDRGYADVISAMYAYSPAKQEVTGFKVVDMRNAGAGRPHPQRPGFPEQFRGAGRHASHHRCEARVEEERVADRCDIGGDDLLARRGTHARKERAQRDAGSAEEPGAYREGAMNE